MSHFFSIRFSLLAPMAPDIKKEAFPKMLVLTVTGLGLSCQIDPSPTLEPIWHLSARVSADLVYFLIFYRTCCIQRLFQFLPGCFKLHAYISTTCCNCCCLFRRIISKLRWDTVPWIRKKSRLRWVKKSSWMHRGWEVGNSEVSLGPKLTENDTDSHR